MEANLYVIFPGFNPQITGAMSLEELMDWHQKAEVRSGTS